MRARYIMSETFKSILARMKERLPDGASAIEGTFIGNNLLTVADELARMYSQDIDTLLPRAFAVSAEEDDLDRAGADIGIERKPAVCAEAIVTITGEPGSYAGILAAAGNVLFRLDDFVLGGDRTVEVRAVCLTPGKSGNVPAGGITEIRTNGAALTAITNTEAAEGGCDVEKDKEYRARVLDKKRNPVTGGSREDYRQWALSVAGVGQAKVIDLFKGPGTVGVYIVASDGHMAGAELLEKVYAYIESVRPCGAGVEVLPAVPLQIDIDAVVILESGRNLADARNSFMGLFEEYLNSLPFVYRKKSTVSYMKTADLLLQADGVEDVTGLTFNGIQESIILEEVQFPAVGTVTLKEAGI